jgi:TPR repeat protein
MKHILNIFCLLVTANAIAQSPMPEGESKAKWEAWAAKASYQSLATFYSMDSVRTKKGMVLNWLRSPQRLQYCTGMAMYEKSHHYFVSTSIDSLQKYATLAAENDNVDGMYLLGKVYLYWKRIFGPFAFLPDKTKLDFGKARYWLELAVSKGNKEAIQELDRLNLARDDAYNKAVAAYNAADYTTAYKYFEADAWINFNPFSMNYIGIMNYYGKGTTVWLPAAASWFDNAGFAGWPEGYVNAANVYYWDTDFQNAIPMFEKAIAAGKTEMIPYLQTAKDLLAKRVAQHRAETDAFMKSYTEKLNREANNPSARYPASTSGGGVTYTTWGTAATQAQKDQESYDKMKKEQEQREKAYKNKWGN